MYPKYAIMKNESKNKTYIIKHLYDEVYSYLLIRNKYRPEHIGHTGEFGFDKYIRRDYIIIECSDIVEALYFTKLP